jgi:hypothetical protein
VGSIPLVGVVRKTGDGEIPRQTDLPSAGSLTGRDGQKAGVFMCNALEQILSRGFGRSSPLNLALVGSFHPATGGTGRTTSGVRAKCPAMKSSTMKGAKALGSKL